MTENIVNPDAPLPDNEGDIPQGFHRGIVKYFEGSYGFIQDANKLDYLIHWRNIESKGFRTLAKCQSVTFYGFLNPSKGLYAKKVRVINS